VTTGLLVVFCVVALVERWAPGGRARGDSAEGAGVDVLNQQGTGGRTSQ
jgi:hypothetical protein